MVSPLTLHAPDNLIASTILSALEAAGMSPQFQKTQKSALYEIRAEGQAPLKISLPVRLGTLLDRAAHLQQLPIAPPAVIALKAGHFETEDSQYTNKNGKKIPLTEKEQALLLTLWQSHPKAVSRENLLEKIWEYKTDLETHTLETHIYRLRQKIETDPARPDILVTDEQGYRLNIAD